MIGQAGRLGVGVIGMGKVGPVIASALRAAGHSIVGVTASSPESLEHADAMLPGVPIMDVPTLVERCELVIIAIPDDAIASLVQGLADLKAWQPGQLVVHLSGAHGTSILAPAQACGAITLAIHPAMTFSGTSLDIARLVGTPFAVTAPAPVLPIAQALVVEMGGEPVPIAEHDRTIYHAALAHGANFLVTLLVQAQDILRCAGVENPGMYLQPLCEAALDRALREGVSGLTGPIRRGDAGTVRAHLKALHTSQIKPLEEGDNPGGTPLDEVANTYVHMTAKTVEMLSRNGMITERAAREVLGALERRSE